MRALPETRRVLERNPRVGIEEGLAKPLYPDAIHLDPRRFRSDVLERPRVGREHVCESAPPRVDRILTADDAPVAARDLIGRPGDLGGHEGLGSPVVHSGTFPHRAQQTLVALNMRRNADAAALVLNEAQHASKILVSPKLKALPIATLLREPEANERFLEMRHWSTRIEQAEDVNPFLAFDLKTGQQ